MELIIDLKKLQGFFEKAEEDKEKRKALGKTTRLINELLSEELFSSLFADYLNKVTRGEWKLIEEVPLSSSCKNWLDSYVVRCDNKAKDSKYPNVFACEVKGWNHNSKGWNLDSKKQPNVDSGKRCWQKLITHFDEKQPLAKLNAEWKCPKNHNATEVGVALLMYFPFEPDENDKACKRLEKGKNTAFWYEPKPFRNEKQVLIFSVANYMREFKVKKIELTGSTVQKLNDLKALGVHL